VADMGHVKNITYNRGTFILFYSFGKLKFGDQIAAG